MASEFLIETVPYTLAEDLHGIVERQLRRRTAESTGVPTRLPFQVESRSVHRFQMEAFVEGHRLLADEGRGGGGTDIAPAPMRYFVAGILLCAQVWVVKMAALRDVPLRSVRCRGVSLLEPTGHDAPDGRGFSRIELTVELKTGWDEGSDDVIRAVVEDGVRACPAAVTAGRGAELVVFAVHNGRLLDRPTPSAIPDSPKGD
jgi:uncharacterized OsmC-like protein